MTIRLIVVAVLLVAALSCIIYIYIKHRKKIHMDDMEGHEFEYYCAGLLENSGFMNVEVTRKSKDYGVDIVAEKDGVTYAVQCKCYAAPVGIKAIQEIYAGRDYYDKMVGVVMTNQYFTAPAVDVAKKLKIMLWDRGYIEAMEEEIKEDKKSKKFV